MFDINNNTELVGIARNPNNVFRALRWSGTAPPVDLNPLLVRPPAGLVLESGLAINDAGTILASSNAGLVLLRPGTRGTDAPVLGPVTGLPFAVDVGQDVDLTLGFVDNDPGQTHTAAVDWTDGCASPAPVVTETGGVGSVGLRHRFCVAGAHNLTVRVTDSGGRSTETQKQVFVEAPGLATLAGSGTLAWTPPAVDAPGRPLRFTLWAPLDPAAAARPFIGFDGPFRFRADRIGAAVRNGHAAHLEGTGTLNGRAGYRFLIDASDGGGTQPGSGDRLRIRVAHSDSGGKDIVDYDNGTPAPAASTPAGSADRMRLATGDVSLRN